MKKYELEINEIANIQTNDTPCSDNLAVALCTYFSTHPDRPDNDEETDNGWGEWVEDKCDEILYKIVAKLKSTGE